MEELSGESQKERVTHISFVADDWSTKKQRSMFLLVAYFPHTGWTKVIVIIRWLQRRHGAEQTLCDT